MQAGPEGLYDRTRARHQDAQRIPTELEQAILSIRRRLQAHAGPATRYCLIGTTAVRAELKAMGVCPLPCGRTIERVPQRNGLTAPRVRLAPLLPRQDSEALALQATEQLLTSNPAVAGGSRDCSGQRCGDGQKTCRS